jgi:peptidoglycan hydrolase-like protein with peptidoglycan-binding domain
MTTLTRTAFLTEMAQKSIRLSIANNDTRLRQLNLNSIDRNHDGYLDSLSEMKSLFRAIDYYDRNGTYHSIEMGTSNQPTTAGKLMTAIRELAEQQQPTSEETSTTLQRADFLQEMTGKRILISQARNDPRLSELDFRYIDSDNNGYISGANDFISLFKAVDYFDRNGDARSVNLGSAQNLSKAGQLIAALRNIATSEHAAETTTSLKRSDFLQEMAGKRINLSQARNDPRLNKLNFSRVDADNNGFIAGTDNFTQLFKAVDYFDHNGDAGSVDLGSAQNPTKPALLINALRDLATTDSSTPEPEPTTTEFKDAAISKTFADNFNGEIKRGDGGDKVVAIQYALGRLGHLRDVCDGNFGGKTLAAVKSFQSVTSPLAVTGSVKANTLAALDKAVSKLDLRVPAIKSGQNPMTFLSDFRQFNLPRIDVDIRGEDVSWDSPDVQKAYGVFVQHYWEVLKENRIEADCKALAMVFMDQFRKQMEEDTFIRLPLPKSSHGSIGKRTWTVATRTDPKGLFRRVAELFFSRRVRVNRPGYAALKKIQKLDPKHVMLYGVNLRYPRTSAHQISRAATVVNPWSNTYSNNGDLSKPEIPLNKLKPGYLIFIDHTGDGRYDHTVNVVKIKKDSEGRIRQLTLAVGSYDDVRDSLASTVVNSLSILNQYCEEVTIDFDENEHVTRSEVTYSSEPSYVVKPRYSARTTIMERKGGGKLKISRWG